MARGANVTAFDASPVMADLARTRVAGHAQIDHGVLGQTLPYAAGAFDLVVCPLAIHYACDRVVAFAELCRILRPGGALVASTQHPTADWLRKGGSPVGRPRADVLAPGPAQAPHSAGRYRLPCEVRRRAGLRTRSEERYRTSWICWKTMPPDSRPWKTLCRSIPGF
jgi:SAM-dependent methyltransferase